MTTPVVRIVRGEPTPEEIAAVLAVLARPSAPAAEPVPAESAWWRSGLPTGPARSWQAAVSPR
jgi:hypothetical protein